MAAGRAIAEKTRLAREAQKKTLDEAKAIISNNNIPEKNAPDANIQEKNAPENIQEKNADPETILTTTQWLSVVSIFLSMVGIYYKREEIKALFTPSVEPKKKRRIIDMD